ncbi:unnamed protein product [Acanthoscelides obtectus]|uniref:Uncharacterized protein n=1 Tax=Acanthoscelides obtectus TaxID=200917 RepID=A0A9P0P5E4_ACAOB|nr:unnamed protein product [Acanthoscelides obtectus]CAK1648039.1 hypothetical protein AOBTE_LOCUS15517 [Acanthoscelides obtectus]
MCQPLQNKDLNTNYNARAEQEYTFAYTANVRKITSLRLHQGILGGFYYEDNYTASETRAIKFNTNIIVKLQHSFNEW